MRNAEYYQRTVNVVLLNRRIAGQSQEFGSCFYLHKLMHTIYYRTLMDTFYTKGETQPMTVEEYDLAGNIRYSVDLNESMRGYSISHPG